MTTTCQLLPQAVEVLRILLAHDAYSFNANLLPTRNHTGLVWAVTHGMVEGGRDLSVTPKGVGIASRALGLVTVIRGLNIGLEKNREAGSIDGVHHHMELLEEACTWGELVPDDVMDHDVSGALMVLQHPGAWGHLPADSFDGAELAAMKAYGLVRVQGSRKDVSLTIAGWDVAYRLHPKLVRSTLLDELFSAGRGSVNEPADEHRAMATRALIARLWRKA